MFLHLAFGQTASGLCVAVDVAVVRTGPPSLCYGLFTHYFIVQHCPPVSEVDSKLLVLLVRGFLLVHL